MSDDDEDGELFDEDEPTTVSKKRKKTKSKPVPSMIDDAAELSGDEGGSDEEEDDDEHENDYVRDGFVVDEIEEREDDLEDSDDDDDDEEEEAPRKKSRITKMRKVQVLDDDDLDLINEARGGGDGGKRAKEEALRQREEARSVKAKDAHDLQKGLFYDSEDDGTTEKKKTTKQLPKQRVQLEKYDEDGMDDFIDDDIGDQGEIMAGSKYETAGGVSEAQMQEASDIFGSDYLDFMQGEEEEDDEFINTNKYKERGVGIDYGVADESDDDYEEDDDLFGDDDDDQQKKEALTLKREKREMTKAERRKQAKFKKAQQAKAELRKNFEPVLLIENFCTERDDEIRIKDAPERFFDWKTPFHGPPEDKEFSVEEEEEAMWIMNKIPEIALDFFSVPPLKPKENAAEQIDRHQREILESITHALRYMHREKLEPSFIKRYRKDYVTSASVRDNLFAIMDEDGEWDRMISKRDGVDDLLTSVVAASENDEAKGAEEHDVIKLKLDLEVAQEKLDDVVKQETKIKDQLRELTKDDDEDDDDLFKDEDQDDEKQEIKDKQKSTLEGHLATVQEMLQDRAQRVADLAQALKAAQARTAASDDGPSLIITKKMCRTQLWNALDYKQYLMGLTDERHVDDIKQYLVLLREGNDAIRKKEGGESLFNDKKRSRSMNNDLYRSRVSEGLRPIAYEFMLAPCRAGIKLEEMATKGQFSYDRTLPGEEGSSDPLKWVAPVIIDSPVKFASDKIGSGELVQISAGDDSTEDDPLSGCRFVAAIELAYEPRIRRHLRAIFREKAVLTTRPTKKGLETIDAFHDYYGLHLIKNKPIKEHFPMEEKESEARKAHLGPEERKELGLEMKKRESLSCLQYLRILEAEQLGQINVHVHMPYLKTNEESWFKEAKQDYINRENQDLAPFMAELEKVFLPLDGDTDEWNEERRKIFRFALTKVILPDFERETRRDLRDAATKVGVTEAGENLKLMAMEGPYRPTSLNQDNRFLVATGDLPLVGVCTSADGKDATYLASVTEGGAASDHVAIPSGTRIDNDQMLEKVINFLMTARPSAVVVGTSGGFASRALARKLGEIVAQAVERWNNRFIQEQDEDEEDFIARTSQFRRMHPNYDVDDDEPWKCNVDLVDDSVAQLFGRSVRGKKEFPDMEVNLKCAIAIARHAKDPLSELAYAWNVASDSGIFGTEMFYLNIHPMQRMLPRTKLLRQYEREICEAVAEVGVDINASCTHDHLLGLLSFVPGLGPRKAANLKQSLTRIGGLLGSRRDLLAKRLMGPTVYNNAVAFLRIRDVEKMASQFIHPLDDTRLHPDVYHRNNWAVKIAVDALERLEGDGGRGADKDSFGIKCLKDVISNSGEEVERLFSATKSEWETHYGPTFNIAAWDPIVNVPAGHWRDKVEELDLEAFANIIEQNGMGRWNSHLQMIKWEFRLPFEDPRKPMEPITGERLFRLVTGETDQSLRPGKEVTGKVVKNGDFGSRVKLEGDIPAFIPLRNLADEHVETAEDIVTVGSVVTAIVTEVKKDHMCVDMSLRMEDFRKPDTSWDRPASLPPLDNCFDTGAASRIQEEKMKERELRLSALQLNLGSSKMDDGDGKRRSGRVTRRACAHPAFRNEKNDEVDRELRAAGDSMVGEALIRPSSKASDSLAIHWVVKPGSIKVIEVTEEEKDNDASIGNILKIKNESYGSIDEMLGRYIAPMNDNVEALTSHRKFVDLPEDELDEKLKEEKRKSPAGIFYNICWMEMHPGYGSLRFILGANPRNHPIGITPEGFTWGSKVFSNLDKLLNEFKKNPRGVSSSSNRSMQSSVNSRSTVPSILQSGVHDSRIGGEVNARPSRWGARPPPPPGAPPLPQSGWGSRPPVPVATYGVAPAGFAPPPSYRPPPPNLPPPGPPNGLPPPAMGLPPVGPPHGMPPRGMPPSGMPPPPMPHFGAPPPGPPPPYRS